MRKILTVFLLALVLFPRASAAEAPKYLALTFDEMSPERAEKLLDGLLRREARATFFLSAGVLEENPGLAERILKEKHEVGILGFSAREMSLLSRREMARELTEVRALLPQSAHPRFLRLEKNAAPRQVCQVARATGLALLGWNDDLRDLRAPDASAAGQTALSRVRSGDVILMAADTDAAVDAVLNTVDNLRKQGFRFTTVSELARIRGERIAPGEYYRCFPSQEP